MTHLVSSGTDRFSSLVEFIIKVSSSTNRFTSNDASLVEFIIKVNSSTNRFSLNETTMPKWNC